MKYAVQLYTVRELIHSGEDLLRLLGEVRALGYEGVEFAGVWGLPAESLRARLDELGLTAVGAHLSLEDFAPERLSDTLRYYRTLGCRAIGVGGADTSTEEALSRVLTVLDGAQKVCEPLGMTVYFHNHTEEFRPTADSADERRIVDRLKEVCRLQIDTYWSFVAGVENASFLRENRAHICSVHLKDGVDRVPCALGEGQCDVAAVLRAAESVGIEWGIVENDEPRPDGLADIARSMSFLRQYDEKTD